MGFYWRYEKLIRQSESRSHSTVGATGAIYALRRALFEPIREDTILDDVLIPMKIVRQGYRVLFESEARAYDRVVGDGPEEFTRKVRTIAGNFQLFARQPWLAQSLPESRLVPDPLAQGRPVGGARVSSDRLRCERRPCR